MLKKAVKLFGEPDFTPVTLPARKYLTDIDANAPKLEETKRKNFHSIVMMLMCMSHRGRRALQFGISFLLGRLNVSTEQDYEKLRRIIRCVLDSIDQL